MAAPGPTKGIGQDFRPGLFPSGGAAGNRTRYQEHCDQLGKATRPSRRPTSVIRAHTDQNSSTGRSCCRESWQGHPRRSAASTRRQHRLTGARIYPRNPHTRAIAPHVPDRICHPARHRAAHPRSRQPANRLPDPRRRGPSPDLRQPQGAPSGSAAPDTAVHRRRDQRMDRDPEDHTHVLPRVSLSGHHDRGEAPQRQQPQQRHPHVGPRPRDAAQ